MERIKSALGVGESEGSIYDILKMEHRLVAENLLRIIEQRLTDVTVFSQTISILNAHMAGEESLLYPRLEAETVTRFLALKSFEEHDSAKATVNKINASQADDRWLARVEVLYDLLNHHINFEENQVFPAAKNIISEADAMDIGRRYQNLRTQPVTPTII